SFPSGHTSAAFLLATALTITYQEPAVAMCGWAGLVALSRVILGVHYPGDTLAGAVMGSGIALFTANQLGL
ncbi:MAG: phosphatase PAP2 family protein, partial [Halioglobus sp.]|nr:phosphatase PAP2 family protein [Halioglobus sp.]